MFYSSRIIALMIAATLTMATAIIMAFTGLDKDPVTFWLIASQFVISYGITWFALEFFVFSEINKLYTLLDTLRKKDYKVVRKTLKNIKGSPLKKLNTELYTFASKKEQEIDHLKEAENYRREFLADISHELKTPIFSAQGFIHTLLEGAAEDPNVRDRFLKKAAKSLDGLNDMVQDLLTLTQMENGVLQMHQEHFEIVPLIEEIFDLMESKAGKKEISLVFEKKIDRNAVVFADRNRIGQVLTNLIANAIKYGKEGGEVTLGVEVEKEGVQISVNDNGPGIANEHLKRIFDRFYRIEKSRGRERGGSGLGLAIVKQIIEAHHSKVSVVSKLGKGTSFIFKLKKGNRFEIGVKASFKHPEAEQML